MFTKIINELTPCLKLKDECRLIDTDSIAQIN